MQRRLGCLTPLGLVAAFVALVVVVGITLARGGVLFNPGPLNAQAGEPKGGVRSHAEIQSCSQCHPAFWSGVRMADLCLECHTEVADEIRTGQGLHAFLLESQAQLTCRGCHTEHRGPDAPLTVLDPARFPHEATGFSLKAHRGLLVRVQCADCHTQDIAVFDRASCYTCHVQEDRVFTEAHRQTFGENCLACHDGVDRFSDFDHNRDTRFPLEDAHRGGTCSDCHLGDTTLIALRETPTTCVGCHAGDDAHDGAFGQRCETCHQPTTWEDATFDHAQTGFPLTGAHAQVACQDCHTSSDFTVKLDTACVACHQEPDYHRGLFGTTCEACHTTTAWQPAKYDEPHRFPIDHGAGLRGNSCQVCHPNTLQEYTCYGCHEHNPARIAAEHREEGIFDFQNCVKCHPTGREEEGGFEGED